MLYYINVGIHTKFSNDYSWLIYPHIKSAEIDIRNVCISVNKKLVPQIPLFKRLLWNIFLK